MEFLNANSVFAERIYHELRGKPVQCPLLNRITLCQSKSDNNSQMIQLDVVFSALFRYILGPIVEQSKIILLNYLTVDYYIDLCWTALFLWMVEIDAKNLGLSRPFLKIRKRKDKFLTRIWNLIFIYWFICWLFQSRGSYSHIIEKNKLKFASDEFY